MKIVPFIHRNAPELCYFTVNGIRYREKPMIGKQVNWYKAITDRNADHPVAMIREKHFRFPKFVRVCTISVEFPDEKYQWLNDTRTCIFTDYKSLMKSINDYMVRKHSSYRDPHVMLYDGSIMPQPTLTIKTFTKFM